MKTDDLKKLGITDEAQIDAIMKLHGVDIESHKAAITTLTSERDTFKSQLEEAGKQISDFTKMDIEGVKKAATDWETKAKQLEADSAAQLAAVKFDHALDSALATAKAKNPKAVKALLDLDTLKKAYDEKTGTIIGFEEHIKPVRSENDYLFESDKQTPRIVAGGNNQPVLNDPMISAMRKAAGLKEGT